MKGIVFTEFMEMVDEVFSPELLDLIIEKSDLPNGGAYTSVGTYDHQEMVRLVVNLSEQVNIPIASLLQRFGQHLFGRFTHLYPAFFRQQTHAFEFLKKVDSYIHVEVKKLYPDAELPRFFHDMQNQHTLVLYYLSSRHLEDLAIGLISGCLDYFQNKGHISHQAIQYQEQDAIKITIELSEPYEG